LTAAQLAGDEALPEALPMTSQVEDVFLARVRRLSEDTRRFLLIAAADDYENLAVVTRAAEICGLPPEALDLAEHAGLVAVHGARLEFRHPLVRSAVYESAASQERRSAHRALADAFGEGEEHLDRRAWHLAASTLVPDETVVAALEEAARRARSRGAHVAAAKALERAAQLSATPDERGRRLVAAARAAGIAGAHEHAAAVARQALPLASDPAGRADLALVLADAEIQRGRPLDAVPSLMVAAHDVAAVDPRKALELLVYAMSAASEGGDLAAHQEAADIAASIASRELDDWSRFVVDFLAGCAAMVAGDAVRGAPLLDKAVSWALETDDPRVVFWASAGALWVGDDELTEALATRAASIARSRGAIGILTGSLGVLGSQRLLSQRFDEAELAAAEALDLARELGSENYGLLARTILASVAAVQGRDDEARRHAGAALDLASARGLKVRAAAARRALALVGLGRGLWADALTHLDALSELGPGESRTLVAVMTAPDRVEAAVRAGEPEKAGEALATFEAWALSSDASWAQARLASCRGLVADGEDAIEHFEDALRLADAQRPFDVARIHLLYGEHLRRERRRIDARMQLRAAIEGFERLAAEPWAARARTGLRATGETARKRDPSTINELTPQELQIARHVADGLSNKEIAALLFLSPRTIDSHLRNIFGKLDITSRIQLARIPMGRELDPAPEVGLETSR
jgi:DNA-binding CsgD family transcriptional regulator